MCLAIPGKILQISESDSETRMGKVSFEGVYRDVNLSLVPDAKKGDYVMVHVGFAISVVDQQEAQDILQTIREIDYSADPPHAIS